MPSRKQPFTKEEFDAIYSRVPRLVVEVVLRASSGGVWLAKRTTPPAVGTWHITGGTVLMGETLVDAVGRIAAEELMITAFSQSPKMLGPIEYNFQNYPGFPIGIVYEVRSEQTPHADTDGDEIRLFDVLPDNMIPEQRDFLIEKCHLSTS